MWTPWRGSECSIHIRPYVVLRRGAPRAGGSSSTRNAPMATIGFIGLGNMGRPMASNLVRQGFPLVVHDVVTQPVEALAALGAKTASSVTDVTTASDIVITMLPDSAIVETVIT